MLKTYLYIPDHLNEKITQTALRKNKSKAEVIRHALEKGIHAIYKENIASAQALLSIAEVGEKYQPYGPKDLSTNLDRHLWGIKKK